MPNPKAAKKGKIKSRLFDKLNLAASKKHVSLDTAHQVKKSVIRKKKGKAKSSISGEFVNSEYAKKNPDTTYKVKSKKKPVETAEVKQAKELAKHVDIALRMSGVFIEERKHCWLINETLKQYGKKKGNFSIWDASLIRVKADRLFAK